MIKKKGRVLLIVRESSVITASFISTSKVHLTKYKSIMQPKSYSRIRYKIYIEVPLKVKLARIIFNIVLKTFNW